MEQDSTKNGSAGDKRSWRDRLGVSKGLPKLADEFRSSEPTPRSEPRIGQRTTGEPAKPSGAGGGQVQSKPGAPIARPAPMAPRIGPRPAPERPPAKARPPETQAPVAPVPRPTAADWRASKPAAPSRPSPPTQPARPSSQPARQSSLQSPPSSQPAAPRPTFTPRAAPSPAQPPARPSPAQPAAARPASASTAAADAFGERLRAQREAAERLAQQRLAAARERSTQAAAGAQSQLQRPPDLQPTAPQPKAPPPSITSQSQPSALPSQPEPAVGIETAERQRPEPEAQRPRFTFAQEEIVAAKREVGIEASAPQPAAAHDQTASIPPPYSPPQGYSRAEEHVRAEPRAAPPPYVPPRAEVGAYRPGSPAYPPYAPTPEPEHRVDSRDRRLAEPARRPPRPEGYRSTRPRDYEYEDDLEGMFEDERPARRLPRPRASAAEYSAAYREFEEEYEDEEPRCRAGPLILLLSLLAVAAIAGGLIYWYQTSQRSAAPQTGDVPVITAPQDPVKAEPEPQQQPQQTAQPVGRKQIYDRILGEETLEPERIVPTEEQPQLQQIQQPPAPTGDQGLGAQGTSEPVQSGDPLPLPLPPPPGTGDQGQLLGPPAPTGDPTIAATEVANDVLLEPAASSADAAGQNSQAAQAQLAVDVDPADQALAEEDGVEADEADLAALIEREIEPEQPAASRTRSQQTNDAAATSQAARAPASQAAPLTGSGPVPITPTPPPAQATQNQFVVPQTLEPRPAQPVRRASSRDDDPLAGFRQPFSGSSVAEPAPVQQVASLQPQPAPQQVARADPQPAQQETGEYVVQLASFRSEAEALSEFQRLAERHPRLVGGLGSRIQKANLGQSGTFYRLGVGPVANRTAATQLCNALIAAGEKDCLVRRH